MSTITSLSDSLSTTVALPNISPLSDSKQVQASPVLDSIAKQLFDSGYKVKFDHLGFQLSPKSSRHASPLSDIDAYSILNGETQVGPRVKTPSSLTFTRKNSSALRSHTPDGGSFAGQGDLSLFKTNSGRFSRLGSLQLSSSVDFSAPGASNGANRLMLSSENGPRTTFSSLHQNRRSLPSSLPSHLLGQATIPRSPLDVSTLALSTVNSLAANGGSGAISGALSMTGVSMLHRGEGREGGEWGGEGNEWFGDMGRGEFSTVVNAQKNSMATGLDGFSGNGHQVFNGHLTGSSTVQVPSGLMGRDVQMMSNNSNMGNNPSDPRGDASSAAIAAAKQQGLSIIGNSTSNMAGHVLIANKDCSDSSDKKSRNNSNNNNNSNNSMVDTSHPNNNGNNNSSNSNNNNSNNASTTSASSTEPLFSINRPGLLSRDRRANGASPPFRASRAQSLIVFNDIDRDKNGKITRSEFEEIALNLGLSLSHAQAVFDKLDHRRRGFLEALDWGRRECQRQTEVLSTMYMHKFLGVPDMTSTPEQTQRYWQQQQLRQVKSLAAAINLVRVNAVTRASHSPLSSGNVVFDTFKFIDTDGSGDLSKEEIRDAFLALGVFLSDAVTSQIMTVFDGNGDGTVNYVEFVKAMFPNLHKSHQA